MLILYTTEGCHLCEMAFELYQKTGALTPVIFVDVAESDQDFAEYGIRIPVLSYQTPSRAVISELAWPFDFVQLQRWLQEYGIN